MKLRGCPVEASGAGCRCTWSGRTRSDRTAAAWPPGIADLISIGSYE